MRTVVTIVLLVTSAVPLNARKQTGAASDTDTKSASRVFLTHRKYWLASGGFNPNHVTSSDKQTVPDFVKDFRKRCPKLVVTDMQDTADYAVTIDEIGLLDSLTGPSDEPTFKLAVYSRNAGLLYMGGTSFLKNAVKDACNAIGPK